MSPGRPPIASVDVVREELRRLGYLDHSLDRFVLAGAGGPSALRASLGVAGRVGLVGGVVFGLTGAFAAALLDRRLLAEPRDLLVLGVYLVLAFGLVAAAVSLGGALLAAWARRRGRRPWANLARHVGLAVALASLFYFTLWGRSHLQAAPLLARAAALVLGVGLSLTLGRFAWLAAVAVLSAGGIEDRLPKASLSRRRVVPLLFAATAFYAAGVAGAAWLARPRGPELPDYTVVPTGLRVRVLGIDGLERRMAEQLIERGEMPHLAAGLRSAAGGTLGAEPERVPAIVWTTIATGRGPEAHGIRAPGARRVPGLRTPVSLDTERGRFGSALGRAAELLRLTHPEPPSAILRGAKTFWNVASEKGLRVGVVNWWATWPAEAVNGYVVTDRAAFRLERGGAPDREVYPPEALDRLRGLLDPSEPDRARRLDRFHLAAVRALRGADPPDLEAVYLPGLDIVTMQQLGEPFGADLALLDSRLAAVRDYYRFIDSLVGEYAADRGPEDILVIVADPGRLAREGEAPEGLILLVGGPVKAADIGTVSERDVTPTVLHLLGLPRSRELDGAVLESALGDEFRRGHPVRSVDSYGRRSRARAAESAFDAEVLEELRSLGYIK